MGHWLVTALRQHTEIAFFITLAIGYLLGRIRIGGLSLGAVTGTLLAGVLIGQFGINISPEVKQCFFVLFLFSIGYRCGPQFFQALGKDGLVQAAVSTIVAVTALFVVYVIARVFDYDSGTAGGVIAGSLTQSATIGTTGDAIARLPLSQAVRTTMTNHTPVAFAVTYLIGVIGSAWFLSRVGPLLMGVNLAQVCAEYEAKFGGGTKKDAGKVSAHRNIELRAYRIPEGNTDINSYVEGMLRGARFFVERIRRGGQIIDVEDHPVLRAGDIAAISGPRGLLVEKIQARLPEVEDAELLDVPAEQVDVFVTKAGIDGKSLVDLADEPFARGVYLRRLLRNKMVMPMSSALTVQRGDVLTIVGIHHHIEAAIRALGVADRPEETTDMTFVSAGVVIGALVGLPAFAFGKLEIGLSLSVGVLLAGLIWGWLRSVRPTIGYIPSATLWLFESLGLTGFIAVVGLSAGPDFVQGLRASGLSLVAAGVLTVVIPHFVGIMVGYRIFKMHPGILLGVCAGGGTAAPALAAVQEAAKSAVPTLGFGVSYAIGNVLLALWGTVIVALLA